MRASVRILVILCFIAGFGGIQSGGQTTSPLPEKFVLAMNKGDAAGLSPFLNQPIELLIPGNSGVFSREQAHFILKSFFDKHPVTSFRVLHHGTRENSNFAIARYTCRQGMYRVYFLMKSDSAKSPNMLIHQIRIEKQDD